MTDNLHSPSESLPVNAVENPPGADFYVVSIRKLTVLYLATMGMYQLYWFYRNWRLYKNASGDNVWPVPRAVFPYFFVGTLFRHVQKKIADQGLSVRWDAQTHGSWMAFLLFSSVLLDRAANKSLGSPYTDLLSIGILIPLILMFRKAQVMINLACRDAGGMSNDALTGLNYVWIVIGAVLWILFIALLMLGEL